MAQCQSCHRDLERENVAGTHGMCEECVEGGFRLAKEADHPDSHIRALIRIALSNDNASATDLREIAMRALNWNTKPIQAEQERL